MSTEADRWRAVSRDWWDALKHADVDSDREQVVLANLAGRAADVATALDRGDEKNFRLQRLAYFSATRKWHKFRGEKKDRRNTCGFDPHKPD